MAKSVIIDKPYGSIKSVKTSDFDKSEIIFEPNKIVIENDSHGLKRIKTTSHPITRIKKIDINTKIESVLPFRVKFTNIGISGYGPGNPAPIGIAVIGFNNYIL